MDFSFRKFTWILCSVYLCGVINADDSFSSKSQSLNNDYPSNTDVSEDKTQFPSLDNLKQIQIHNGYGPYFITERPVDKVESFLELLGVNRGILSYIKSLLPRTLKSSVRFIVKYGSIAITAIPLLLIGSIVAAALCLFSDSCSSKFGSIGWEKSDLEESFRSFVTPEKMSFLGNFVQDAINKYSSLNKKKFRSVE